VRFEVLTASIIFMRIFWDTVTCSLAGAVQRFRRAVRMDEVRSSETSVYSSETTGRYIPEDSNLQAEQLLTVLPNTDDFNRTHVTLFVMQNNTVRTNVREPHRTHRRELVENPCLNPLDSVVQPAARDRL
jgi:hypothetical protein